MAEYDLGTAQGRIVVDSSSLAAASAATTKFASTMDASMKRIGTSMVSLGKNMTKYVTLPLVGVGYAAVKAFTEAAAVSADTTQVIKSTGGAANVTADDIASLSERIRDYSGIEDEAVQAGANMLLTFTNIRNEVGKGNDIFDQSTEILADMSVKFGGDMSQAAIKLGKALNDPLKGVTALTRVGVVFTDEQKAMIQTMMENNDVIGAQKIILGELNREFGGQAMAQGATDAGKLKIAMSQMGDVLEEVGAMIAPMITKFAEFFKTLFDGFSDLPGPIKTLIVVFGGLLAATGPILVVAGKIMTSWGRLVTFAGVLKGSMLGVISALRGQNAAFVQMATGAKTMVGAYASAAAGAVGIGVALGLLAKQGIDALSNLAKKNSEVAASIGKQMVTSRQIVHMTAQEYIKLADAADTAAQDISLLDSVMGEGAGVRTTTATMEQLDKAFMSGNMTVQDAIQGYTTLQQAIEAQAPAFDFQRTAAERAGSEIRTLSERMFAAGRITRTELIQNLQASGQSFDQARARADELGKEIQQTGTITSVTGKKIRQFAGMTAKEFDEWKVSVTDNLRSAAPALETLAQKAKLTSRAVINAFNQQEKQLKNYADNLRGFAKLNVPDELKQQIIDMGVEGSSTMAAFNNLSKKELREVSSSFRQGQDAIDSVSGELDRLGGDAVQAESDVRGLNGELGVLDSKYSNLDLYITTHFRETGSPPKPNLEAARGGIVSGMTLVGERGPEMAVFPRGTMVFTAAQTQRILSELQGSVRPKKTAVIPGFTATVAPQSVALALDIDGVTVARTVELQARRNRITMGRRG